VYRINGNGVLFYYNGATGFNFETSRRLCHQMGGHLPSIHGTDDLNFLKEFTDSGIWLGSKRQANGSYTWDDGTRFGFQPWYRNEPNCHPDACCAMFLVKKYRRIAAQTCEQTNMHVVCQINSSSSLNDSVKKNMTAMRNELTSLSNEMTVMEKRIQELNESSFNLIEESYKKAINYSDEQTEVLDKKVDKVIKDFKGSIESLERLIFQRMRENNNDVGHD
jgi:hypothetical protein